MAGDTPLQIDQHQARVIVTNLDTPTVVEIGHNIVTIHLPPHFGAIEKSDFPSFVEACVRFAYASFIT